MSYTERRSNVCQQRRTPEATKITRGRESRGESRADSRGGSQYRGEQVRCSIHKESLMFFCEQEAGVMCMQCMYKHMKQQKNHNVCSISDAASIIARMNLEFKTEARRKIEEIDKNIITCKGNKSKIEQAFELHQQLIGQEFAELERLIKNKQQQARAFLQKVFKSREEEIGEQMNELNYMKKCLKEHYEFSIESSSSQIYFFNAYSLLRNAISKYSIEIRPLKKEQFVCFDKYASLEDFSSFLQKFYKPRDINRDSKAARKQQSNAPSRASEKTNQSGKVKQHFIQETKKKLQRLNKIQNEKTGMKKKNEREDYLNNFFIE